MRILSIDTSCDDTCIAIIETFGKKEPHFRILSNIVSSQVEIHKKWGGVYPSLAKREHQKNLLPVLREALNKAKLLKKSKNILDKEKTGQVKEILEKDGILFNRLVSFVNSSKKPHIDAITITAGPGLEPCLWSGINLARSLSYLWKLPLIPVNHIEAHIFSNWLKVNKEIDFPAICLVVSGGHTELILMRKMGSFKILGETRDDAAGECFDKVARILGLRYPGGPIISAKAAGFKAPKFQIKLPRPMLNQKNYDFSFSGLKTAILYDFKSRAVKIRQSKLYIQEMCFETQQSIIDVLLEKTKKATKDFDAETVILGGGVTANTELRRQFKKYFLKEKVNLLIPEINLSTDNAAMVGVAACFNRSETKNWKEIAANANLNITDDES